MFSCDLREVTKNTYYTYFKEHHRAAASAGTFPAEQLLLAES